MALKVRIEDVAAAAGVSMKTVSRVLNREPNVREDTRARVQAAVDKLKYTPSSSARSLAGNKSYLIALLYNNPSANYLMEIMGGVLAACEAEQYNMMNCPLDVDEHKLIASFESLVARSQPDGVVLTPPITDSPALLKRLAELDIPYASISPKQQTRMGADMDETRAAADMVEHLVSLGHRRIAHIVGHPAHGASGWRLTGYRQGLEKAGLRFDPELVVPGEFSFESGVLGAEKLLQPAQTPDGGVRGQRRHGRRRHPGRAGTQPARSRRRVGLWLRRHADVAPDLSRADHGAPAEPRHGPAGHAGTCWPRSARPSRGGCCIFPMHSKCAGPPDRRQSSSFRPRRRRDAYQKIAYKAVSVATTPSAAMLKAAEVAKLTPCAWECAWSRSKLGLLRSETITESANASRNTRPTRSMNGSSGQASFSTSDSTNEPIAAGQRAGFVGPLPEQAQHEDHHDARREEAGVFLDVLERLVEAAEQRPCASRYGDHHRGSPRRCGPPAPASAASAAALPPSLA